MEVKIWLTQALNLRLLAKWSVTEGDSVTVLDSGRNQQRVRLAEIDTPERGQPWGTRARKAMADKVFRKQVRV